MKAIKHIEIFFIDNDNLELEYFRDNFKLGINFKLFTFSSPELFLNNLRAAAKEKTYKIVIIDYLIKSRGLNTTTAIELLPKIKAIKNNIEVIIFADSDNIELKATGGKIKPAAYIKKDSQYFIRLDAIIYRLISEYELKRNYTASKRALILFIAVLFVGATSFLIIYRFFRELL